MMDYIQLLNQSVSQSADVIRLRAPNGVNMSAMNHARNRGQFLKKQRVE